MPKIDPSIPSHVLREQITRWYAELSSDAERLIKGPLEAEGYDADDIQSRMGAALGMETSARGEQGLLKATTATAGRRVTALTREATHYVHDVALRAQMLVSRGLEEGTTLLALAESRYLPPEGGSFKDVTAALDGLIPYFRAAPSDLPGLGDAIRERALELRLKLYQELLQHEHLETRQEDATSDATQAGQALRAVGDEYLAMRAVAEHNHGPLPGGDMGVLRHWAETRPGAVAARRAAAELADAAPPLQPFQTDA